VAEPLAGVLGVVQVVLPDQPDQALVVGQPAGGVTADAVLVDQVAGQRPNGIPLELGQAKQRVGWPGISAGGIHVDFQRTGGAEQPSPLGQRPVDLGRVDADLHRTAAATGKPQPHHRPFRGRGRRRPGG
jgi:hypothetical protein